LSYFDDEDFGCWLGFGCFGFGWFAEEVDDGKEGRADGGTFVEGSPVCRQEEGGLEGRREVRINRRHVTVLF
jgi:hypothetical protein